MIALEAVLHDEQVDTDLIFVRAGRLRTSSLTILIDKLTDLGLTDLVSVLDLLDEVFVRVDAVALLEDDGADLGQRLLYPLSLDLQLRAVHVKHVGVAHSVLSHLVVAFLDRFAFDAGQVLVGVPDVLVGVLGQQSEV